MLHHAATSSQIPCGQQHPQKPTPSEQFQPWFLANGLSGSEPPSQTERLLAEYNNTRQQEYGGSILAIDMLNDVLFMDPLMCLFCVSAFDFLLTFLSFLFALSVCCFLLSPISPFCALC